MTSLYDSITPSEHWNDNVINFESICGTDEFDVKIWNMIFLGLKTRSDYKQ